MNHTKCKCSEYPPKKDEIVRVDKNKSNTPPEDVYKKDT